MSGALLETDRLILRRTVEADLPALMALWQDAEVTRHIGGPRVSDQLEAGLRESLGETDPFDLFSLVLRRTGEVIGHAGILAKTIDGRGEHELIYVLSQSAWGQGYAGEIGAALIAHARQVLGLSRLVALIAPDNAASLRLAHRLGFGVEATLLRDGKKKILLARTL